MNKIMNNKLLMRFGVYCYSIYLLHFLVIKGMEAPIRSLLSTLDMAGKPVEIQFIIAFSAVALVCYFVGLCCFNLIEKPSVNLGKSFLSRLNERRSRPEEVSVET